MSTPENGKGSKPRPFAVDRKTFEENWDKIFGQKEKSEPFDHDTNTQTPRKMRKHERKQRN
jgi:hypothetical protein